MHIKDVVTQFPPFTQSWAEKRLQQYFNLHAQLPSNDEIIGVKDYLASLTQEDKIRQKLNKVSWRDAVQLQRKWHEAIARKSAKITQFEGDAEAKIFINCDTGYNWIELTTPEHLDFEGNAMGHCIGKGWYDKSKNRFFSLRDKNNLPHVTIEFNPKINEYVQIQGRANKPVIANYWEYAVRLFNALGAENGPNKFAHDRDYVYSNSKICFEPEDIDTIIADDNAFIVSARIKNTSFGITTEGRFLYLTETAPPEDTTFRTVVLHKDSNIRDWKWDVSDDFIAFGSLLETVSASVKFGSDVYIGGTAIRHWQNDVKGNFIASGSLLETVSVNVKFGKGVYIEKTNVKHWANDVPGLFYASGSLLETVDGNVKFGGDVYIKKTNIRYWHNDVPGNFEASESLLESVSDYVKFGKSVYIEKTNVRHWQNDVPGKFQASGSLLETVSANVKFGGDVCVESTKIQDWHNDVSGDFYAQDSALKTVADGVKFGKDVYIKKTRIRYFPNEVRGNLSADFSFLKRFRRATRLNWRSFIY